MSSGTSLARFETYTLAQASRMGGPIASTLGELAYGLSTCSDESFYRHSIVAMRAIWCWRTN